MTLPPGFESEWLFEDGGQVLALRHRATGMEVRGRLPAGRRSQEEAVTWTHGLLEQLREKVRACECRGSR